MTIAEAYRVISQHNRSAWVAVAAIAGMTGHKPAELATEIEHLLATDENFRAEPQPHRHRITEDDRRYAPIIGGDALHQVSWT
jgi:hypothetical protein